MKEDYCVYGCRGILRVLAYRWFSLKHSTFSSDIFISYQMCLKCLTLSKLYYSTTQLCGEIRQKLDSNDTIYICQLFSQATLPYLYEIEINHQNILSTIGHSLNTNNRFRRGLINALSRLASIHYGNIENIHMEFIFSKIAQLTHTNKNNLNLIPEQIQTIQTKLTKTTVQ